MVDRRFGTRGRAGRAQDLVESEVEKPALMTAGRWKSSRKPARYTERQVADRGAVPKPIPTWDVHFGGLDDDRKDSTAPHITFRPQLGGHRQCDLAICTFHLGFSLVELAISRLRQFRSIATRYEKRAENYLAMLQIGSIPLWL